MNITMRASFVLVLAASWWQVDGRIRGASKKPEPRKLTNRCHLKGFGGEPHSWHYPLQEYQGDCDRNSHCAAGLVCFQRNARDPVPGCPGEGEQFDADTDFCIPATPSPVTPIAPVLPAFGTWSPTFQPTDTPTDTPTSEPTVSSGLTPLEFVADDVTSGLPLGLCQGDCDTDNDCLDDFICFERDRFEPVPGCSGQGAASIDYCTIDFSGSAVITMPPTQAPIVTPAPQVGVQLPMLTTVGDNLDLPLGLCEGDCDTDDDCLDELVCFQRDMLDPVPGCSGEGRISYDYCIIGAGGPVSTPAPFPEVITLPASTPAPVLVLDPNPLRPLLVFVGDEYYFEVGPLGLCQGDCDTDDDCLDNLVCFQREGFESVPGCTGSGEASIDYCTVGFAGEGSVSYAPVPAVTRPPQLQGVDFPFLQEVGDNLALPLGLCQGDCDSDVDCLDELICFQRDLLDAVPGCIGQGQISYDYCIVDPTVTIAPNTPPTSPPVARPTNPPAMPSMPGPELETMGDNMVLPLGLCQGDCDSDADCLDDLICFQRIYLEPVDGCSGTGDASYDYCIMGVYSTIAPTWPPFTFPTMPPVTPGTPIPTFPILQAIDDGGDWPLGLCQGDCDTDADCLDDLVCYQRHLLEQVPGCSGRGRRSYDYCTRDVFSVSLPIRPTVPSTVVVIVVTDLVTVGNGLALPLGLCEGDCDTDDDCLDELVCFQRDLNENVPGCSGTGRTSYDYCTMSGSITPSPTSAPIAAVTMTPGIPLPILEEVADGGTLPLGLCQGDCDSDFECLDNLICFQRQAREPVPGCSGFGRSSYDYCVENPNTPRPTTTPLIVGAATAQPVTAQPVTAQPVTAQPVTAPPVTVGTASPVTAQPVTAQPVTAAPITAPPVVPLTAQPVTAQPVTAQPVTAQPVTAQPVTAGTAQPVTAQPVTAQPVTAAPITAPPVVPLTAQPVTAQPVTAQPVTAQPVTAQPVTVGTAQPVTAQPVTAQPVTAQPVTAPPVLPVTAQPITAAPITAPPVTAAPVPAIVIEAVEAPPPSTLPVVSPAEGAEYFLTIVDSKSKDSPSKDDKYDKYDKYADLGVLAATEYEDEGLGRCEGKCKHSSDCQAGLTCAGVVSGGTTIPGCSGTPYGDYMYCTLIQV